MSDLIAEEVDVSARGDGAGTERVDLLGQVVRLQILIGQVLDRTAAAHGISAADYLVLAVIRRSPERRSAPTAICDILGRTTGGMTLTLDRLERSGWIRRRRDPGDRRRVVVEATDAGARLAQRVNAGLHEWEESLALSTAQRRDVRRVLDDLAAVLDAEQGSAPAG